MSTPQKPIGSGFGERSTALEVVAGRDLKGKTAIVTGGYSGIGLEVTRALASAGATVVVPARSPHKAKSNLTGIKGVEQATLDLMDPLSIDAFAKEFIDSGRALDILVNSAGVMAPPLARDSRGYESQFSSNHLGHFHLAARLWPALRASGKARVVAVSSHGHRLTGIHFEDPNFERRKYRKWSGYGQSKSANILFAKELDRRGAAHGVRAFSLHPGSIVTDLMRHMSDSDMVMIGAKDKAGGKPENFDKKHKTPEQGASTVVWCATSPQLDGMGGVYCMDCDITLKVHPLAFWKNGVASWAVDQENATRLWALSERLTGVTFETGKLI